MFVIKCILGLGLIGLLYLAFNIIFPRIEFDGVSMSPTYEDGEIVRGSRIFSKRFKIGHVYVFTRTNAEGEEYCVIKRLSKIKESNDGLSLFFKGDNDLQSVDSRHYGYLSQDKVIAKVIKPRKKQEEMNNETIKCS